jgi:hypothetical protein
MAGSCEHDNEPSGSVSEAFLDLLSDCYLMNDSAPYCLFVCLFVCHFNRSRNVILKLIRSS